MLAGIVLAGGAARRLSGVDKTMVEVGGEPLLRGVLRALGRCEPVVVVGPRRRGLPERVRWTREDPPGSGPVAALAAGVAALPETADPVAVLAGDLTGVTAATVDRLAAALRAATPPAQGALLVDRDGHRQWLVGVWRAAALRAALPERPAGASLRGVLGGLSLVEVPALPGEADDVDTPADLDRARRRGDDRPR
ncbi:Molybdopterin-guanine dinucleotide biosynthesis protein A [Amycolatopsis arida]|uniref:Molybdopterin-guanine dinucleotide biosynthesis protein A n=1 Tax=Amycolatopsis arida TaxID=587909 RepID=A0A1I5ZIW9_9PSEU|nr:nucleotidyltransferase family protein [Amycolatopsis arida]TDX89718.1 molybdopterin-guanine dinucleotide biosynthesis protein A [Amycolatopsis arida]SFQ56429.1 Molybdopterin-guanine dinucleotide biosynthesis protein A [Amycolatopsis arida]